MTSRAAQKHLFYTEMAKLLEAGFGIRQAILAILDTKPPAAQVMMLKEMDGGLAEGKSIVEAFGNSGGVTDLERSIVGAGERGGRLAQAFQHLADYFQLLASARRDAVQALIYPIVLLHMGVFLAVVPQALMDGKGAGEILISGLVTLAVVYAGAFVLWLLASAILKAAPTNPTVDAWLGRIPVIGKARRSMAMARFTKVYHTGVLAGLTMTETLMASLTASYSGIIRRAGVGLLERAKEGNFLGPEFVKSGAFPAAFARSYATAEEAGGLDKDLERWAKVFQEEAARGAKAVSIAVPKVCYGLALIFVVWKILSFYTGYYEMLDGIGE